MSSRDEELIDYEDENDITNGAPATAQNGAAAPSDAVVGAAGGADADKDKKNYTGIHSTGFRSVDGVLVLEGNIIDACGHPSETFC